MGKKIAIISLAILTIALGAVAVFIAVDLNNQANVDGGDTPVGLTGANYAVCGGTDECRDKSDGFQLSCSGGQDCKCRAIATNNASPDCSTMYPQGVLARSCQTSSACSDNPQPDPDTGTQCTPYQWFGCNNPACGSGEAARCKADGSGLDCFADPSACGSSTPPTSTPPVTPPTTPVTPPPVSASSDSSATTSTSTSTADANQTTASSSSNPGAAGTTDLPETGIIDEKPLLSFGVVLIIVGLWFTIIRIRSRDTSLTY